MLKITGPGVSGRLKVIYRTLAFFDISVYGLFSHILLLFVARWGTVSSPAEWLLSYVNLYTLWHFPYCTFLVSCLLLLNLFKSCLGTHNTEVMGEAFLSFLGEIISYIFVHCLLQYFQLYFPAVPKALGVGVVL